MVLRVKSSITDTINRQSA